VIELTTRVEPIRLENPTKFEDIVDACREDRNTVLTTIVLTERLEVFSNEKIPLLVVIVDA